MENVDFTEAEFKMIIDGLDKLQQTDHTSSMIFDGLMKPLVSQLPSDQQIRLKRELDANRAKEESKREALCEEIKILQGKILLVKRTAAQNNAMRQTNDILNIKS